jgi:hypothetical protein
MGLVITNVKPGSDQLDEPDTSDMADPSCSFNQRDASQPVQLSLIRLDFRKIGDPRLPKTWFWVAEK